MIYQLLLTITLIVGLMLGYYLVQRSLRRVSPEVRDGHDVLETRWGCGHCSSADRQDCPFHSQCEESESENFLRSLSG